MRFDPEAQPIVDALAQMPTPDFTTLNAQDYRASMAQFPPPQALDDVLAEVADGSLPGPAGPLCFRSYRPEGACPFPVTLFFHGGGFIGLGLDSHDNLCRRLAARAGTLVVSVAYRLAPEHPYPAAVDDALAATCWVHANAAALGGDPTRLAVAGDSAGGTLAAVVAQQSRALDIAICHQLLLYPATDSRCDTASYRELANAPMLPPDLMRWFWRQYLGADPAAGDDARASPLRQTDLRGLAPATVITAEFDPLRDEGEAYARALQAAGVPVSLTRWAGQFHGFASLLVPLGAAREALEVCAAGLRQAFAEKA